MFCGDHEVRVTKPPPRKRDEVPTENFDLIVIDSPRHNNEGYEVRKQGSDKGVDDGNALVDTNKAKDGAVAGQSSGCFVKSW